MGEEAKIRMTTNSEVGISPVLLQAITQTLSSNSPDKHSIAAGKDRAQAGAQHVIMSCDSGGQVTTKIDAPSHVLHGMNEPVYATTESGDTIMVVQNLDVASEEQVEIQTEHSDSPRQQYIIRSVPEPATQEIRTVEIHSDNRSEMPIVISQGQELHMSNVLSAIATHLKNNRKRSVPAAVVEETVESTNESQSDPNQSQPIYISIAGTNSVPSPVNDVTVHETDNVVTETIVHHVQTSSDPPQYVPIKKLKHDVGDGSLAGQSAVVLRTDGLQGTVYQTVQTEQGHIEITPVPSADGEIGKPCPICGDRISGYHYGIFTCESCKGFFKRTVQNKKAFICHRKGDCLINLTSRKKCPACRFKRCLLYGMRLEAIREDRMRGGRSSYEGCSPHGRTKVSTSKTKDETTRRKVFQITSPKQDTAREPVIEVTKANAILRTGESGEQMVTVVSVDPEPRVEETVTNKLDVSAGMVPQTPQTLEDLLAVEALMAEDDEEQECCYGKLRAGDEDLFGSLLHLADHCLYRIVRWARNLPDFAEVSTDDQILLLQSCWAELLCLSVCWNSVKSQNNTLLLSHGRELDLEMAKAMGLAEVIQRLLDFTEHLRRLDVDLHEYISLKVLLLMTPDVKNLKNEDVIRDYQERICESLLVYSITHYPHLPNKHCELLCRLTELTRTCSLTKELLTARQVCGEVPPLSLLSELLKGDIIVQPTE